MDLDMPGGDGATATRALAQLKRTPKVLILTLHTEEECFIHRACLDPVTISRVVHLE